MGPSKPSSTYDFALSTIHTTEETENNGTVVTNLSASMDSTSIKNNKDSKNDNTYKSLRNSNTELLSTNSSSMSNTEEIHRSLNYLTANVRRNMHTAKSELDNIFKRKFDKIQIPDIEGSDNSNSKILPENIQDEDINLHINSSRHNQIVSLLTERDKANIDNSTSSPNSKVHDMLNDDKEDNILPKN